MRQGALRRTIAAMFGMLLALAFLPATAVAAEAENPSSSDAHRFNVVMVVDASGSMLATDPSELRFEAVKQFSSLLASKGNYLGSVVFTTGVAGQHELAPANSQEDKNAVVESIKSVPAEGHTNIGDGLDTAVDMIKRTGNPDLPSAILLLSDGNTDMPSQDELQASLDEKAQAIQRARDAGIRVYSVCLNADGSADASEMQQISDATGGEFREVRSADDLYAVYQAFYSLIYGTSTVPIFDGVFPESGVLETEFTVPGIGVEEVNIIINGNPTSCEIQRPDGAPATFSRVDSDTFTMLKMEEVVPGTNKLVTRGAPGDAIRIEFVPNSDLDVKASIEPSEGSINPEDDISCTAYLSARGERAKTAEQYAGFSAELQVYDSFDELVESTPMKIEGGAFAVDRKLPEGTYKFKVSVEGNGISCATEFMGPLTVSSEAQTEEQRANTPPTPVSNPYEASVLLWPFMDNTFTLDLNTLATDDQAEPLQYKVVSSAFAEGDYAVDDKGTLTLSHFSLSTGDFTVRAVDKWGLSCDVPVIVKSHNVGLIALIGIAIAALIAIAVFVILLRIALNKPFRGDITVDSLSGGKRSVPKTIAGTRGRLKLARFELEPTGLDYGASYFQATGDTYIELHTNIPVSCNGTTGKVVRIDSGPRTTVDVGEGKQLTVRFESRMPRGGGASRGGGAPRGTARSTRPQPRGGGASGRTRGLASQLPKRRV